MQAEPNELDCLILDEAHRIRATSVNRYTSKKMRDVARSQIDELLAAARVPVFLLDEFQVVRPGEVGTVEIIKEAAADRGIVVDTIRLDDQFRCGGSEVYVDWVLRLLGLVDEEPIPWRGDDRFEVDVASSPAELEGRLAARRDLGHGARIAAGYCWPWSDPRPDGSTGGRCCHRLLVAAMEFEGRAVRGRCAGFPELNPVHTGWSLQGIETSDPLRHAAVRPRMDGSADFGAGFRGRGWCGGRRGAVGRCGSGDRRRRRRSSGRRAGRPGRSAGRLRPVGASRRRAGRRRRRRGG